MTNKWASVNALYQIYPRSFQDSNSDGIGDLPGITARLDYIKTLADAIWLSPIYQSPQKDFGYDVSSFTDIAPEYGTFEDFDRLVSEAHARGIKVMMDFVPNHTSDQHQWFKESRSSLDNPKRDWYVWRDGRDGHEPNNWVSLAGGKSWQYDEQTGQYYLHSWLSSQPDLNWENPAVRLAMNSALEFWLKRGVDGFRFDAVWVMAKDTAYRDDPVRPGADEQDFGGYEHTMCRNGVQLNEYLREMAATVQHYDGQIILEYYSTPEFGDSYRQLYDLQAINPSTMTAFFFDPLNWPLTAQAFGQGVADYLRYLPIGAAPVFCFGNHDQTRIATRYGGEAQARLIATLQLTLPGMPCIYYGEEIGMHDGYIAAGEGKDGFGSDGMMAGRDPERTPMQWDAGLQAGFSEAKPWLPVDKSYAQLNAAAQAQEPMSILALYRKLLQLRREKKAFCNGQFELLGFENNVLAYQLVGDTSYTVMINFNDTEHNVTVNDGRVICSSVTVAAGQVGAGQITLAPFEAIVIERGNE